MSKACLDPKYVFLNVRFLVEKLKRFSKIGNRTSLEVDVQTVDGSFHLEVNDGSGSFTQVHTCFKEPPPILQVYTNVKNVIARISPNPAPPGPRPALLINCHFDSVPQVDQQFSLTFNLKLSGSRCQ